MNHEPEIEYNKDNKAVGEWVLTTQLNYHGSDKFFQPIYKNDVVLAFKSYRFPQMRFDNVSDN
jgi:hypothetical protein